MVTVTRIYNNNVVLCTAADGSDLVLVGKGLGYAVGVGGELDSSGSGVRRFVPDQQYRATHVAELLSDATLEEADVAHDIVEMAGEALGFPAGQRLLLPVLDHLSFAVSRARAGIVVDFPLQWEVAQVFPREADVGRRAVELVRQRLGVTLQPEEWSAFALHVVTYQWSGGDLQRTLTLAHVIGQAFALLGQQWGRTIDQSSMSAARFVTHLRYLWIRVFGDAQLEDSTIDIMASVSAAYPEAAAAAQRLSVLFADALGARLTAEETAYLALHTSRLYVDSKD